ncbi:hypothetical protein GGR53DRAFT_464371 [Hypoxylon sp. FL1150]|nr:hypothetical protein GGR53DRAFT_464371 [Hypoxylon sp. FL1150]
MSAIMLVTFPMRPSTAQLVNHLECMKWYFEKAGNKRFRWIGLERRGNGSVSIRIAALIKTTDGSEEWKDFIIKTPFWGSDALLKDEDELLKVIQGRHIIRRLCLPGNPLDQNLTVYGTHFPGPYVVLEYLENGTLSEFIERATTAEIPHLSNRLLWLMFRCLISMCIEMEFPGASVSAGADDSQRLMWDRTETGFRHPNLSTGNILMGKYESESADHQVCPVLKLTSFGRRYWDRYRQGRTDKISAPKENLFSMGMIMQSLIILDDNASRRKGYFADGNAAPTETQAGWLIPTPEFLWLDTELRRLVIHCAATDENDRPDLRSLWDHVQHRVTKQEASGTADSDSQIRLLFQRLDYTL